MSGGRRFTYSAAMRKAGVRTDGQEIVIRLDIGPTIALVQHGTRGFEAGQRVRVLTGAKGSRVEHL